MKTTPCSCSYTPLPSALLALGMLACTNASGNVTYTDLSIGGYTYSETNGVVNIPSTTGVPGESVPLTGDASSDQFGVSNTINWSLGQSQMTFDLSGIRGNSIRAAISGSMDLKLMVDVPTSYNLTGIFQTGFALAQINDRVTLRRDSTVIFDNFHNSYLASPEARTITFVTGEKYQASDILDGSTSGIMEPGYVYRLVVSPYLYTNAAAANYPLDSPVTVSGSYSLDLVAIPEPGAIALVAIGFASGLRRRRS